MSSKVHQLHLLLSALSLVACTGVIGSGEDAGVLDATAEDAPAFDSGLLSGCMTNERYFAREVWAGTLEGQCLGCHNAQGVASASDFVLQNVAGRPDAMQLNYDVLASVASLTEPGSDIPLLLRKPLGQLEHGGGNVLMDGDSHFRRLEAFVDRLETPVLCDDIDDDFLNGVELETPYATLRRFALLFGARLPTAEEIARVDAGGEEALGQVVTEISNEEAFADRVAEGFNDVFLTQGTDFHIAGLGTVNHPDLLWFLAYGPGGGVEHERTNRGITGAVDQLIKHIVFADEPFTQVLLADYTMTNPYAARSFGVFDTIEWNDPQDPEEFRPTRLHYGPAGADAFPHSGVLNTYVYLDRYPSTPTNVNRARGRAFLLNFLGTDILKFAPLNSDPLAILEEFDNPTRDAAPCAVCHVVLDPIAGLFHNFESNGARYPGPVPVNTFPPGFELSSTDSGDVPVGERNWSGGVLPADRNFDSLRWLAERTVADPRFSSTMTRHFFTVVLGRPPLEPPIGPPSLERDGAFRAYEVQQAALEVFRTDFIASDFDAKALVHDIVMSAFYRAIHQAERTPEVDAMRFDLGVDQLLTPEQLHRKILAIFGDPFKTYPLQNDALMAFADYRILYGGVDSTEVTERLLEPNGIMGGVQQLIANNVSCRQASREFDKPAAERLLLSGVELDVFGADDEAAIRATLVHVHERILGERVAIESEEINLSYEMFRRVQTRGENEVLSSNLRSSLGRPCEAGSVTDDPQYVVRAWAAVINYLMQSYEFLYQ